MALKPEKIKAFQSNKFVKGVAQHYQSAWILLIGLHFLIFIASFFFKLSSFILLIISFVATLGLYLLFKDLTGDVSRKFGTRSFKLSFVLLFLNTANYGLASTLGPMIEKGEMPSAFASFFFIVMDLIVLIASIALMSKPRFKEKFEEIESRNLLDEMLGEEIKPGDAVIGIDVDTNKPVIHPLNDRYLHYLFLGPTGSGKTALSLTPMVWRDLNSGNVGITVIEPKGDFAEKVYAMAKIAGREVIYFNPTLKDCPYFNPLHGPLNDVVENMATTFNMFNSDSSQFFQDANDGLLRRAVKVVKRLYDNDATLIMLSTLIHNSGGQGRKMVQDFQRLPTQNPDEAQEQEDIALWFLGDYYTGISGDRGATKSYENTSAIRTQISKLNSNAYLRKVLNPPKGEGTGVDFAKALREGGVLAITTAQGALQDLGKFLGYFIILQFQSAVFRRPGNEDTRKGNMLFIDEFQVYANMGFANMLTQGRCDTFLILNKN